MILTIFIFGSLVVLFGWATFDAIDARENGAAVLWCLLALLSLLLGVVHVAAQITT